MAEAGQVTERKKAQEERKRAQEEHKRAEDEHKKAEAERERAEAAEAGQAAERRRAEAALEEVVSLSSTCETSIITLTYYTSGCSASPPGRSEEAVIDFESWIFGSV